MLHPSDAASFPAIHFPFPINRPLLSFMLGDTTIRNCHRDSYIDTAGSTIKMRAIGTAANWYMQWPYALRFARSLMATLPMCYCLLIVPDVSLSSGPPSFSEGHRGLLMKSQCTICRHILRALMNLPECKSLAIVHLYFRL